MTLQTTFPLLIAVDGAVLAAHTIESRRKRKPICILQTPLQVCEHIVHASRTWIFTKRLFTAPWTGAVVRLCVVCPTLTHLWRIQFVFTFNMIVYCNMHFIFDVVRLRRQRQCLFRRAKSKSSAETYFVAIEDSHFSMLVDSYCTMTNIIYTMHRFWFSSYDDSVHHNKILNTQQCNGFSFAFGKKREKEREEEKEGEKKKKR